MSDELVRVSEFDRRFVGGVIVGVVGPVLGTADQVLPKLRAMFNAGPRTRVGLIPDAAGTRWRRVQPDESWLIDDPEFSADDIAGALRRLHARPTFPPIQAGIVDGYLLITFEHGLGDFAPMLAIVEALSQPGGPTASGFIGETACRPIFPVPRMIASQFRSDPKATLRTVGSLFQRLLVSGRSGGGSTETTVTADTQPDDGSCRQPDTVYVRAEDGYLEALSTARKEGRRRGSMSALLARELSRALATVDPRLVDVAVVVSLRGLFADGRDIPGNLNTICSVELGPDSTFCERFDEAVRAPELPVRLGLSLALSRLRRGRAEAAPSVRPVISISNVSRATASACVAWDGPESDRTNAYVAVLGNPGTLAAGFIQVGKTLNASVRFDASRYDSDAVQHAVEYALRCERWSE